jgi:phosphoribosylglycinamide formyltransferase 2
MNREGIRRLAAEELGLATSSYVFCENEDEYKEGIGAIGIPCVVKPVMSSSGKGQSTVLSESDVRPSWEYAKSGARGEASKVIVEGFVDFDYEITLLTVQHVNGCSFCEPIGHRQENGDYQESWQPQPMSGTALRDCQDIAEKVTHALGGYGLFGVEFFVKGDKVYFSEVSPRPHDTGMVTMISQDLSEFALHVRAVLGLPIPNIRLRGPSASSVILVHGESSQVNFMGVEDALSEPDTQIRLFGKPEVSGERRMGVCLAMGGSVQEARDKANSAASKIDYSL